MERLIYLLIPAFVLMLARCHVAGSPPNIIYIMADDLGFHDVGWNNENIKTPNLDKMVENGVILNQSYSQPSCTPSRAALLTGYYPYKIGVQNFVVREGIADYVPLDFIFLPKKLKQAGYSTHLVGKWHLGHCRLDVTPTSRGFDTFLGLYGGYNDFYTKKFTVIGPGQPYDPSAPGTVYDFFFNTSILESSEREYTTDIFTKRAIELIKDIKDQPFFIALHYTAPHSPLQVPKRYQEMYSHVSDIRRQKYMGMVTKMDEGIGDVLKALEKERVLDNTIVIFQSDNGGDTHFSASNYPLRGKKSTLYEGGVRVPSLVYSPGLISNTPRVSEDLFHIVDWFSTLLEAAGIDPGDVDGINQWDMLRTGNEGLRKVFIYNIFGINSGIRFGHYKLLEGNPLKFGDLNKRSVGDMDHDLSMAMEEAVNKDSSRHDAPSTRRKRKVINGGLQSDIDKMQEALDSMNLDDDRTSGQLTVDDILEILESYGPDNTREPYHCQCKLYDLAVDPSETQNIAQKLPAVTKYLHQLLALYKKDEVTPVLKFPFKFDPRYKPYMNTNITSNTWCESDA